MLMFFFACATNCTIWIANRRLELRGLFQWTQQWMQNEVASMQNDQRSIVHVHSQS